MNCAASHSVQTQDSLRPGLAPPPHSTAGARLSPEADSGQLSPIPARGRPKQFTPFRAQPRAVQPHLWLPLLCPPSSLPPLSSSLFPPPSSLSHPGASSRLKPLHPGLAAFALFPLPADFPGFGSNATCLRGPLCPRPVRLPRTLPAQPGRPRVLLLQSPGQNRQPLPAPPQARPSAQGNGRPKEPSGGWHRSHSSEGGLLQGSESLSPCWQGLCRPQHLGIANCPFLPQVSGVSLCSRKCTWMPAGGGAVVTCLGPVSRKRTTQAGASVPPGER